jgi:hypothetical protein
LVNVEVGLEGKDELSVPRVQVFPDVFGVFSSSGAVFMIRD